MHYHQTKSTLIIILEKLCGAKKEKKMSILYFFVVAKMNSTFMNNSISITIQLWFIPLDILSIACNIFVIGLAIFFLFTIVFDKTCHTVPMVLVANSCFSELILGGNILWMSIFTLDNDLKQIQYEDSWCIFQGLISYSACAAQSYSYLLQSIYRYVTVIHPDRLYWQSPRIQILLIILIWIFSYGFPTPFVLTREVIYNVDNQICQLPLRLSFSINFTASCVYITPVSLIALTYFKLVRYVHQMNKRVMITNTLFRKEQELKMVRRTVILVMILFAIKIPYVLMILTSFFTTPPKHHFQIAYAFINISLAFVMITLFQFTTALKLSIRKRIDSLLTRMSSISA